MNPKNIKFSTLILLWINLNQRRTDESEDLADEYIDADLDDDRRQDITLLELTKSDLELDNMIVSDDDIQPFEKISKNIYDSLTNKDRELIDEIHRIYDSWNSWEPENPIQQKMKSIINENKLL